MITSPPPQLDTELHSLLSAMADAQPGLESLQKMSSAALLCRKMAIRHPALVIRYNSMQLINCYIISDVGFCIVLHGMEWNSRHFTIGRGSVCSYFSHISSLLLQLQVRVHGGLDIFNCVVRKIAFLGFERSLCL